jgi:hypothetical protein
MVIPSKAVLTPHALSETWQDFYALPAAQQPDWDNDTPTGRDPQQARR